MNTAELAGDDWLGIRLGKPCWHLGANADPVTALATPTRPAFIDCKVPVAETIRCQALTDAGFKLIDTAITLERPHTSVPPQVLEGKVRPARNDDADAVVRVAGAGFSKSRFHADPQIDRVIANRIKADWAGNFFAGKRGDWMVVAEREGQIAGFLQLLGRDGHLVIDLIAVDSAARGKRLATNMIEHASASLMPGAPMRVGTQLANTASVRLYESLGFRLVRAEHVLHCHIH